MTFYYAHQVVINLKTLTSYSITSTTFNLLLFFGDAGFGRLHMIRMYTKIPASYPKIIEKCDVR